MYVRMKLQLLVPGVQNTEETDLLSQLLRIFGHFEQRFSARPEQKIIDCFLVLGGRRGKSAVQREHHVRVLDEQQFPGACSDPAVARLGLAAPAMAVTARVIADGAMSALRAGVFMRAEHHRPAAQDSADHLQVQPREPGMFPGAKRRQHLANDIGHLDSSAIASLTVQLSGLRRN